MPDADTRSADLSVTAEPDPIQEEPCQGCGPRTGQLWAVTTLTIAEHAGVGARVVSIAMRLHDAADTTIASGSFETGGITQLAGSARVPAGGTLAVPHIGPHYDEADGGHPATLTYTVTVRDDNGHDLTRTLDVAVTP